MTLVAPWFPANPRCGLLLEELVTVVYDEVVEPGMAVVDGGAHLGVHTFPLAKRVGSHGVVLAFEAIEKMATELGAKAAEQSLFQVKVINKALSDRAGLATFAHVIDAPGYSGLRERPNIPNQPEIHTVTVETEQLDVLAAHHAPERKISFIKLDLEGGEFHTLKGAYHILDSHRPVIVFENGRQNAANLYGYTRENWFDLFRQHKYEILDIFGRPFTEADWTASPLPWYSIGIPNGVAVKERIIRRVQSRALELP